MNRRVRILVVRGRTLAWTAAAGVILLLGSFFLLQTRTVPVSMSEYAAGRVVVIDPGHGGADPGAVSATGLQEKDITLAISLHLERLLQRAAMHVFLTRRDDTDLADPDASIRKSQDLGRRVAVAARSGAHVFISVHANSSPSPVWSGAQTFYYPNRAADQRLAELIQDRLVAHLGPNRRRAASGDYYVLRESSMPSVVVEVGFLSNPEEAARLGTPDYQKRVAEAIYMGILDYFAHSVSAR